MNAPVPLDTLEGARLEDSRFTVPGMRCAGCIAKIERGLSGLEGVESARVNFSSKRVAVRHEASLGEDDLVRLLARVEALSDFVSGESGVNLMAGYKSASNILRIEEKKDNTSYDADVSASLLREEEERKLYEALIDVRHKALPLLRDEDYAAAMTEFARLREPVDTFFEKVTVNSDNADERANRLKLLAQIRTALHDIADFSKIES